MPIRATAVTNIERVQLGGGSVVIEMGDSNVPLFMSYQDGGGLPDYRGREHHH